ncbi:MAG: hypothetical protein P8074_17035 [Anaerolineales bacterium]
MPGDCRSILDGRIFNLKRTRHNSTKKRCSPLVWFVRVVFLLASGLTVASCTPVTEAEPLPAWQYSDLRELDPADASSPGFDILAIYTRSQGDIWSIRLDLLESSPAPDFDLYLAIDSQPGGSTGLPIQAETSFAWDTLLVIPARGALQALDASLHPLRDTRLRVLRDPVMDTLDIRFQPPAVRKASGATSPLAPRLGFQVQAFLTPAGSDLPADEIGAVRSDGAPPEPAQALFVFWNTFPAYTPAQALRRWDGAHTGPLGGRHGLYNLLRAVRNTSTPIVLLDLASPEALSALDYAGGISLVENLQQRGLLVLPQVLPGISSSAPLASSQALPLPLATRSIQDSRQAALQYSLKPSPFLFAPLGMPDSGASERVVFLPETLFALKAQPSLPALSTVYRYGQQLVVPIPGYYGDQAGTSQATRLGPTIETRKALIQAALSRAESPQSILVLGGNLPASTWGDPQAARESLQYLAAHPWIRTLNAQDLLGAAPTRLPTSVVSAGTFSDAENSPLLPISSLQPYLDQLLSSPPGQLNDLIWQTYRSLLAPIYPAPASLAELRSQYTGQLGVLLAAQAWAQNPAELSGCSLDIDGDGQAECILASESVFSVYEIQAGYLAYLFVRTPLGIHQVIAPSYQFVTGLSDPSQWRLGRGVQSDPDVILGAFYDGAFYDASADGQPYTASLSPGALRLSAASGGLEKTFSLRPEGLQVAYSSQQALQTQVSIALDPWQRFGKNWAAGYQQALLEDGTWTWQTGSQAQVVVSTTASLNANTFKDSQAAFAVPENPNRDYPPGHFLPFPLAVLDLQSMGDFSVIIDLKEADLTGF